MKTPTTGDYRSSFILYDFDGDGEDEAIALYSYSTDETAVYLHFLDCRGGEWLSIADIKGSGSEVYKIEFCDTVEARLWSVGHFTRAAEIK